jgi:nucleotide-binding universal stress UspA family protein
VSGSGLPRKEGVDPPFYEGDNSPSVIRRENIDGETERWQQMKNSGIESNSETSAIERGSRKKTIVAPINLVSEASEALEFALEFAHRWQANLYVVYVYSALPRVSGAKLAYAVPNVDWERHRLSVDLSELVARIRERYPSTFPYFTDNDCPAEAIQNAASKLDADMIIVSAQDKGWLAKLLLYSDADDIARRSSTPVLVYRSKSKAKIKSAASLLPEPKYG